MKRILIILAALALLVGPAAAFPPVKPIGPNTDLAVRSVSASRVDPTSATVGLGVGGTGGTDSLLAIRQRADDKGLRVWGYDDRAASWVALYVDQYGQGSINGSADFDFKTGLRVGDATRISWGNGRVYWGVYNLSSTRFEFGSTDTDGSGTNGNIFYVPNGAKKVWFTGAGDFAGELTAGTKTFKIDHPVEPTEKFLYHMAIEGPRVDLIYRGLARLKDGKATVVLDTDSTVHPMMEGTFEALTQNAVVTSLQNQDDFDRVKPSRVDNGRFTIECENAASSASVAWVVMAERRDPFVKSLETTDADGRLIPEQTKPALTVDDTKDRLTEVETPGAVGIRQVAIDVAQKRGYLLHDAAYGAANTPPVIIEECVLRVPSESRVIDGNSAPGDGRSK